MTTKHFGKPCRVKTKFQKEKKKKPINSDKDKKTNENCVLRGKRDKAEFLKNEEKKNEEKISKSKRRFVK